MKQLLDFMLTEASSALSQAKLYRDQMQALPPGDTRRDVYESAARTLLGHATRLSLTVQILAAA